jgi:RNA polymerase sigma-70 factor (ECF subfamily)
MTVGAMNDLAGELTGNLLSVERDDTLEFEARLADSSALAIRVAYGVVRNRQDAEDVAQEAFARAYRRFASLRDREKFRGWLVRMTWRLAIDHLRSRKRRQNREDAVMAITPQAGDLSEDTAARDRAARLWNAIDQLPDRLRVVIVLTSIEGHGVKEVAALLGAAEGTIKSRMFEARQKLREALE